jgi:hypothetical protein
MKVINIWKYDPKDHLDSSNKRFGVTSTLKELSHSIYSRSAGISGSPDSKFGSRKTEAFLRYKEIAFRKKEIERCNEFEKARLAVDIFENTIERIRSIHTAASDPIDWTVVRDSKLPYNKPKGEIGPLEKEALIQLNNYRPNFLTRLVGKYGRELQKLKEHVYRSRDIDILEYQAWVRDVRIAAKVIAGDLNAYFRIVNEFSPFEEMLEFGSCFSCFAVNSKVMEIEFDVSSEKIVPNEQLSLTKYRQGANERNT